MSVPRVDKADALAYYLRALAPALLDGMVREHAFYGPKKPRQKPWRFDVAWPELKVAVEIDGGQFAPGGGRHAKPSDYVKRNAATLYGWRVLFYRPQQLENDPQIVVNEIVELTRTGPCL